MSEGTNSEKKIFIDEDWKTQVEAEREANRGGEQPAKSEPSSGPAPQLPPPSLLFLADTLAYRAMIALGLMPGVGDQQSPVQLDQAKHAIDLIEILFEKTAGNRTAEETEAIEAILHQLRMAFISMSK